MGRDNWKEIRALKNTKADEGNTFNSVRIPKFQI